MPSLIKLFAAFLFFSSTAFAQTPTAPILSSDGTFTVCSPTPCVSSSAPWLNIALPVTQTNSFRIEFDATPSVAGIDSVVGLSGVNAGGYTDMAVIARFNSTGTIDARNGANYGAATAIPYTAGTKYHFIFDVNIATHSYSVSVNGVVVGTNMAFRSEQSQVAVLKNISMETSPGTLSVCSPKISVAIPAPLPLVLVTPSLPAAKSGVAYSTILTANGGKIPYVWSATGLPAGMVLSTNGVFSGTPSANGTFVVTVTDALSQHLSETLNFSVTPLPPPIVHKITLTWNASAGATGYNVYRGGTLISSVTATGFVDLNVKAGTSYCYLVTATAGSLQSQNSNEVCALVPTP